MGIKYTVNDFERKKWQEIKSFSTLAEARKYAKRYSEKNSTSGKVCITAYGDVAMYEFGKKIR